MRVERGCCQEQETHATTGSCPQRCRREPRRNEQLRPQRGLERFRREREDDFFGESRIELLSRARDTCNDKLMSTRMPSYFEMN